ncbi:DUF3375 family protein [Ectothiorhodospira shaposhnikovii]|uniref:DUF3375 family protein n=1 Tax=Ectothiorhodospira shaposhnikovii TaxID=1054 RepID=UPI001F5BDBF0|nr:DUF3375 family protein [Ectothiorhodospira shaposhnikovii]
MNHDDLQNLRRMHPAWRLLVADNAPMIISFLHGSFVAPNVRVLAATDLENRLEDFLFHLRGQLGEDAYPRAARAYLSDWSADERGWLRRYYPEHGDEPHYDLTPATEQAIQWLKSLEQPHRDAREAPGFSRGEGVKCSKPSRWRIAFRP